MSEMLKTPENTMLWNTVLGGLVLQQMEREREFTYQFSYGAL